MALCQTKLTFVDTYKHGHQCEKKKSNHIDTFLNNSGHVTIKEGEENFKDLVVDTHS